MSEHISIFASFIIIALALVVASINRLSRKIAALEESMHESEIMRTYGGITIRSNMKI